MLAAASTPSRAWAQPPSSAPPQAPPLSPSYVKDTIATVTASRRALLARLDSMDLFGEKTYRPDDGPEVQLLFMARDDYLAAVVPRDRAAAAALLARLLAAARADASVASAEMGRILAQAMNAETSQKKINAMIRIAENKITRNAAQPTLADLMREDTEDAHRPQRVGNDPDAEPIVIEDYPDAEAEAPQETAGAGCAAELRPQPDPGAVPPE